MPNSVRHGRFSTVFFCLKLDFYYYFRRKKRRRFTEKPKTNVYIKSHNIIHVYLYPLISSLIKRASSNILMIMHVWASSIGFIIIMWERVRSRALNRSLATLFIHSIALFDVSFHYYKRKNKKKRTSNIERRVKKNATHTQTQHNSHILCDYVNYNFCLYPFICVRPARIWWKTVFFLRRLRVRLFFYWPHFVFR